MLVGLDGCEVRLCDPLNPCARVRPFVCPMCVRSHTAIVTQTHIHIYTQTCTPWRVPRGGGLEGRQARCTPFVSRIPPVCIFTGARVSRVSRVYVPCVSRLPRVFPPGTGFEVVCEER